MPIATPEIYNQTFTLFPTTTLYLSPMVLRAQPMGLHEEPMVFSAQPMARSHEPIDLKSTRLKSTQLTIHI